MVASNLNLNFSSNKYDYNSQNFIFCLQGCIQQYLCYQNTICLFSWNVKCILLLLTYDLFDSQFRAFQRKQRNHCFVKFNPNKTFQKNKENLFLFFILKNIGFNECEILNLTNMFCSAIRMSLTRTFFFSNEVEILNGFKIEFDITLYRKASSKRNDYFLKIHITKYISILLSWCQISRF